MKLEDPILIKRIIEAAIMAAEKPLSKKNIVELFDELECPDDQLIIDAIDQLTEDCEKRGYELVKVASGYRFQVKQELSPWVGKLWREKAPRYSRALLETLALIAYRQPITRGEIESVRGVAVSSQIIRTLLEREWIKAVGHRDVPGRPAIYATTRQFLDYFNLKSLDQLPPLAELRDLNAISEEFNIEMPPELQEDISEQTTEAVDGETVEGVDAAGVDVAGVEVAENIESSEKPEEQEGPLGDLEVISSEASEESIDELGDAADGSLEEENQEIATQLTDSDPESEDYHDSGSQQAGYEMMASSEQDGKTPLDC